MSRKRKWLSAVLAIVAAAILFIYGMLDVASDSIQFDLRKIGESVYEARHKSGRWPAQISDLEGTVYLNMPYRRKALDDGLFVVVWPTDFDKDPALNRDHILAYDDGSMLARWGRVWVCRGDLSIERMSPDDIRRLTAREDRPQPRGAAPNSSLSPPRTDQRSG